MVPIKGMHSVQLLIFFSITQWRQLCALGTAIPGVCTNASTATEKGSGIFRGHAD